LLQRFSILPHPKYQFRRVGKFFSPRVYYQINKYPRELKNLPTLPDYLNTLEKL